MNPNPSPAVRRDLRAITRDAVAHSGMVGLGETYVPAFALALGHGAAAAGILATAPLLVGALLQLVTPAAVLRLGSHRRWLVASALVQAATFLPLVLGAAARWLPFLVLLGISALYWAAGFSAGSAWNSWMVGIVPFEIRATFFAHRARLAQGALALALLGGGLLLHAASERRYEMAGFATLFIGAAACRFLSAWYLSRQTDVHPADIGIERPSLSRLTGQIGRSGPGRLLLYLATLQVAVFIAAPYFTPYMLEELELSYGGFVVLTGAALVSRIAVLPLLGSIAARRGARALLLVSGLGVVPLAALWLVSREFYWLLGVQVLAGIVWGAHELAVLLLFFETLDGRDRLGLLALYNLTSASAMVVGALLGALIMESAHVGAAGYAAIFLCSSAGRALTLPLLRRLPTVPTAHAPVPTRVAAVRPSIGAIQPPIVAALDEEETTPP